MSIRIMSGVWTDDYYKNRSELLLMLAIADHAHDNGEAWPSIEALAHKSRCSERQVQAMVNRLVKAGKLSVARNAGPNYTNIYRVILEGGGAIPAPVQNPVPGIAPEPLVKGTSKVALKPLKEKARDYEAEALHCLFTLFSSEEISAYGGNWRLRYRECPQKFMRVVEDLIEEKQSGKPISSFAAIANIRWHEFEPQTKR